MDKEKMQVVADGWLVREVECPYCGEIQQVDGDTGDEEKCQACGETFILPEFTL